MAFAREPAIERPLGATEDMYWRFDKVSPLNFGFKIHFTGQLSTEHLKAALLALQKRHPLLRSCIRVDEDGSPWFRSGVGTIPLQEAAIPLDDEWPLLEGEVNTAFDSDQGPLLRCIINRHAEDEFSLLMIFHHAASDGKSVLYVTQDLLDSLAQLARGEAPDLEPLPLMEYYGNRIHTLKDYADVGEGLNAVWKTLKASLNFMTSIGLPTGIRRKKHLALERQRVIIEPRTLDAVTVKRLAKKAKAEGVTIQCVLNAALSIVVAEEFPRHGLEVTSSTQVLDIRDRLHPPVGANCGVFVSGATSLHDLDKRTRFWGFARDIRDRLLETMDTPLPFFHPAMHNSFKVLAKLLGARRRGTFTSIIKGLHPEGLAVSNLGRVSFEDKDAPIKIKDMAFGTNTNAFNYFNTSAISIDGRMNWSFSGSTLLGRERIAMIADKTIKRMLDALHE